MTKKIHAYLENRVAYEDRGTGEPIVFIHGFPTSSYLWKDVIAELEGSFRCVAPDLMGLGDSEISPDTDLSMQSQVKMVLSLMDELSIGRANIVAHDQGGAVAQLLAARHGGRVKKLALIDVVCYDNWLVPGVKAMQSVSRVPALGRWILGSATLRAAANAFGMGIKAGFHEKTRATKDILDELTRTVASSRERVERFRRFLLAADNRVTIELAPELRELRVPTLIVWAQNDRFLDSKWGHRLADDIPGAQGPVIIPECGHFAPWEKPVEIAEALRRFLVG